ncbi:MULTISPECIES: hypothetical protein [Actinosynnema]|uniref:scabin-related ADP-ribosyltransferase n=1 Tax=Actinosynnema TaxID=40566 RepID=UPI0020A4A96A|nr:hypothetical protein [Actinosynnema pretiosum]MCP2099774.1 Heat-labile enterotoxin alpha chain [Actinosynnema pretiosum]
MGQQEPIRQEQGRQDPALLETGRQEHTPQDNGRQDNGQPVDGQPGDGQQEADRLRGGGELPPVAMRDVDPSRYGVPESQVVHRDVPEWRRAENALVRGDTRSPEEVRAAGGFDVHPRHRDLAPDLLKHVDGDTNAFVSTSTDETVAKERAGRSGAMYVINAPGGINTDATLDNIGRGHHKYGESEMLFPGGIDWRYVAGWHEVEYQPGGGYAKGPFVPNPDFIGHEPSAPGGGGASETTSTSRTSTATGAPSAEQSAARPGEPSKPVVAERPESAAQSSAAHPLGPPPAAATPRGSLPVPGSSVPSGRPAGVPGHHAPWGQQSGGQHGQPPSYQPPANQPSAEGPRQPHQQPGAAQQHGARQESAPWNQGGDTTRQSGVDAVEPGRAQHDPSRQPEQSRSAQPSSQAEPPRQSESAGYSDPEPWRRAEGEPARPRYDEPTPSGAEHGPSRTPEAPQPLSDQLGHLNDDLDQNVRQHVYRTESGMALFDREHDRNGGSDKSRYYTSAAIPRIPGQFVVDLHGSENSASVGRYPLSARDLAEVIRSNPHYDRGEPITLISCGTGRRDDGFAARLASELGVPVTAPNTHAWVDYDGNVFASDNNGSDSADRPGWPPNGEWRTFSPDGEQRISESPTPPGHTPDWGELPSDAPLAESRGGSADEDFRELRAENRERREEALEFISSDRNRNPASVPHLRPHERTLTTARFTSDSGSTTDAYNFSGKEHNWRPASEAPVGPPRAERIFETAKAGSYDPVTGGWRDGGGSDRVHDSEPKLLEDLARNQLAEHSGLSRDEVDDALRTSAKEVAERAKADPDGYGQDRRRVQVERARDRVALAIDDLNNRAAARAETAGTTYRPFTAADVRGDLRMVIDLPSAKIDRTPPEFQICKSCQTVLLTYEGVFPNVRVEAVNLANERLYPL